MKKSILFIFLSVFLATSSFAFEYESEYKEYTVNMSFTELEGIESTRPIKTACYKTIEQLYNKFPAFIDKYSSTDQGEFVLSSLLAEDYTFMGTREIDNIELYELFEDYTFIGTFLPRSVLKESSRINGDAFYNSDGMQFKGNVVLYEKASNYEYYVYSCSIGAY